MGLDDAKYVVDVVKQLGVLPNLDIFIGSSLENVQKTRSFTALPSNIKISESQMFLLDQPLVLPLADQPLLCFVI